MHAALDTVASRTRSGAGPSDAVSILEARAGQAWAKEALFRRYAPLVNGLTFQLLGGDSDLDDLVQESFAQALSSLHRLRNHEIFAAWISSIVVRTANKLLRRPSTNLRRHAVPQLRGTPRALGQLVSISVSKRNFWHRSLELQSSSLGGLPLRHDFGRPERAAGSRLRHPVAHAAKCWFCQSRCLIVAALERFVTLGRSGGASHERQRFLAIAYRVLIRVHVAVVAKSALALGLIILGAEPHCLHQRDQ